MSERVTLKRHSMRAKDDASGDTVEFGEMLPIGESGKMYPKSYVSIPEKGGWYVQDKQTGQILSRNPVIGLESYDGMGAHERSRAIVKPAMCPSCSETFKNQVYLDEHTVAVHGQTSEVLHEQHQEDVEAQLQAVLKEMPATVPKRRVGRPKKVLSESSAPR